MLRTTIILLLFQTALSFGQKKPNSADSVLLSKVWTTFVQDLSTQNIATLKKTSFKQIDCLRCLSADELMASKSDNNSIPVDTFYRQLFSWLPKSKLWTVIRSDEKPFFWTTKIGKSLVYEILIHTYKANEIAKGHEGGSDIFQFKKVDNKMKLWGFSSIP